MGIFYRDLAEFVGFGGILEILCKAEEFQLKEKEFKEICQGDWKSLEEQVLGYEEGLQAIDYKTLKKVHDLSHHIELSI
jgi:hypothetical protein